MAESKTLEMLFANSARPRMLKLFIFNPEVVFDAKTLIKKILVRKDDLKKEVNLLLNNGFIKKRSVKNAEGRKVNGYVLNQGFKYLSPLRDFLVKVSPFTNEFLVKKLNTAGRMKLIVISGVFVDEWEARIDLLVVGDRINTNTFNKIIKNVESELGREIKYVVLENEDFEYRLGVGDKLIRDIFDNPHEIISNKIGLVE